jgi:exodeoxyribonuclease-5
MTGYLTNINKSNSKLETYNIDFRPEFFNEKKFVNIDIDKLYFDLNCINDNVIYDNYDKYSKILRYRKKCQKLYGVINKFTYGYCITCYKSQGSEFDNVVFIQENLGRDIYWNHLYTGITRAKEKLVLIL